MTEPLAPRDDDRLSAYLDNELDAAERVEIERLLQTRADYRQAMDALRSARDCLRAFPAAVLPSDFAQRVARKAWASPSDGSTDSPIEYPNARIIEIRDPAQPIPIASRRRERPAPSRRWKTHWTIESLLVVVSAILLFMLVPRGPKPPVVARLPESNAPAAAARVADVEGEEVKAKQEPIRASSDLDPRDKADRADAVTLEPMADHVRDNMRLDSEERSAAVPSGGFGGSPPPSIAAESMRETSPTVSEPEATTTLGETLAFDVAPPSVDYIIRMRMSGEPTIDQVRDVLGVEAVELYALTPGESVPGEDAYRKLIGEAQLLGKVAETSRERMSLRRSGTSTDAAPDPAEPGTTEDRLESSPAESPPPVVFMVEGPREEMEKTMLALPIRGEPQTPLEPADPNAVRNELRELDPKVGEPRQGVAGRPIMELGKLRFEQIQISDPQARRFVEAELRRLAVKKRAMTDPEGAPESHSTESLTRDQESTTLRALLIVEPTP